MSTVQHWWIDVQLQSINDGVLVNFGPENVRSTSGVFATVAEIGSGSIPFQGAAMISVWNVVPHDNGQVSLVVRVVPEFFGLRVRIRFLITND